MPVAQRESAASFVIVNPATGQEVTTYSGHSDSEVEAILAEVGVAQKKWQAASFAERGNHFRAIAGQLRQEANENRENDGAGNGQAHHARARRSREMRRQL